MHLPTKTTNLPLIAKVGSAMVMAIKTVIMTFIKAFIYSITTRLLIYFIVKVIAYSTPLLNTIIH